MLANESVAGRPPLPIDTKLIKLGKMPSTVAAAATAVAPRRSVGAAGFILRVVASLLFAASLGLNVVLWNRHDRSLVYASTSSAAAAVEESDVIGGVDSLLSSAGELVLLRNHGREAVIQRQPGTAGLTRKTKGERRGGNKKRDMLNKRYNTDDQRRDERNTSSITSTPIAAGIMSDYSIRPSSVERPTIDIGLGGSDISKASRDVTQEDWQIAYEISLARFHNRSASVGFRFATDLKDLLGVRQSQQRFESDKTPVIELLRVPKGASTHLSITGRALAGCKDPGYPCCIKKHDGEYCPKEGLYCGWVKNCVGHGSLKDPDSATAKITQLRNPADRLLSGFFYSESVHNKRHKGCATWQCFKEYLSDPRLRNAPMTKMLNGRYMYHGGEVKPSEVGVAKENLCKISWFGMLEMPLASKLLLYEMEPFRHLRPHPVVFDLPPEDDGNIVIETHHLRKNKNSTYEAFVERDYKERNGLELIVSLNEFEFDLYAFSWGLFCARIRESGLLQYSDRFDSAHHFDECLKPKYDIPTVNYCP